MVGDDSKADLLNHGIDSDDVRVLSQSEITRMLNVAADTRYPERNKAIILLATDAGLTPREMANLFRRHVMEADGSIAEAIDLRSKGGKYLRARITPMPRESRLWRAVYELLENAPATPDDPLVISERALDGGGATADPGANHLRQMKATSISYIFWKIMKKAGVQNASAFSARTTFIALAGRTAVNQKLSLRNVLDMSGQRSLDSLHKLLEATDASRKQIIEDLFETKVR